MPLQALKAHHIDISCVLIVSELPPSSIGLLLYSCKPKQVMSKHSTGTNEQHGKEVEDTEVSSILQRFMLASQHKRQHTIPNYRTKTVFRKKEHKTSASKAHLENPKKFQARPSITIAFLKNRPLAQGTSSEFRLARQGQGELQASSNIMEIHF